MSQLIIGYSTEGVTDDRFLCSIIQRTFEEVAFDCKTDIEIVDVVCIPKYKGLGFVEQVMSCCKVADEDGILVLCIHADADDRSDDNVFRNKITPALERIADANDIKCKNVIPIVPVQMIEAWMLVDKQLLKDEIGTNLSDNILGIDRLPENMANPKEVISEAIRIARSELPKRRRKDLTISELYQPIAQKLSLEKLKNAESYNKFKDSVKDIYRALNYM